MAKKKSKYLGEILVGKKLISAEELREALLSQESSKLRLGQILIKKGIAREEEILRALAEHYNIQSQLHLDFIDPDNIFAQVPPSFLTRHRIVPYQADKNTILVAVADALNIQPIDSIKMLFPSHELRPVLTLPEEIQRVIHTHFAAGGSETTENLIDNLEGSDFEILSETVSETDDILDMANDAPIIKLVNTIIRQSINERASDIHFEPYEKELSVRFRIDGILYQMYTPPKKYQSAIISRVKIMSNLNIAENRLPQDGRIQLKVGGKDIDIRVSTFPTQYGERIVLRILNKSDMVYDLNTLGFNKRHLNLFHEIIKKTNGIMLVTGPTGCGKSTTLYSVLTELNTKDVNILTVEDPVEYQLHGVGQMQVKPKIDLTFANGLRSILRQDPDIVMIGEIRDVETAQIAVQAALTGHRVFSTLHTNDAASAITRLVDMGIEPFLIASSLNAVLAQRLIRLLCPACKEPYKPAPAQLSEIGIKASQLKNGKLYKGRGCEKCLNTGYSGRTGIYELLPISNEIKKLILTQSDSGQIKEIGMKQGMVSLLEDGLEKAIEGITTVEEVLRVS